jgi:NAD(P) transhydrogenase subunit beta
VSENLSSLAYLVSSICFIMALRGLSSPVTALQGNRWGMSGMALAIATTLLTPGVLSLPMILLGLLIGGAIGTLLARRIQMTALPQLVAAFHSLVGLAAVFVAAAAFLHPEAYHIGTPGNIHGGSLVEMSLGLAIGAITFTGSLVLSPSFRAWFQAIR